MSKRSSALRAISLLPFLCSSVAAVASAAPVRIAVSYFANRTGDKKLDPLQRGLADMLITDLAASNDVVVVERDRLAALLGELKLQKNPYFDKRSAGRLGKGLGAAYLVTGSYLLVASKLSVEARIVDVDSSAVALTLREQGPTRAFFALQKRLAARLLKGLGAKLSLLGRKRIGARGSKSFGAFSHYARSLAARDRGDKRAEKAWLKKALAADAGFVAVKKRLTQLEGRVARLERSGGLIVTPTSTADHLHNARLHRSAARYGKAGASIRAALALAPLAIETWALAAKLPSGAKGLLRGLAIKAQLRPLYRAFARNDVARLHAALKQRWKRRRALAAALLFERVDGPLPLPSALTAARLYAALRVLREPSTNRLLAAQLLDAPGFFVRVNRSFKRKFGTLIRELRFGHGFLAVLSNRTKRRRAWPYWDLRIKLYDDVDGAVTLRLRRHPHHPHWRERALNPRYLGFAINGFIRLAPQIRSAIGDAKKLVYRAQWPVRVGRAQPRLRIARFGAPLVFAPQALRCRPNANSITGRACSLSVYLSKGNLLPGCYQVDVSYTTRSGEKVALTYPVAWANEFKLLPRPLRSGRMVLRWKRYQRVHVITERNRAAYAKLPELARAGSFHYLLTIGPIFAEKYDSAMRSGGFVRWKQSKVPYPLESIHFDIDYALAPKGKSPVSDDFKGWQRYRDRLIKRGKRVAALPYRPQFVPLPKLSSGKHHICIAGLRRNGSRSAEAECMSFFIP